MSEYLIQDTTLSAIADAIRDKTGSTDSILTTQMASIISSIQTGSSVVEENPILYTRFYDYDGTLKYEYTLDELKNLSALPDPPSHDEENLVSQGWNWSLDDLKNLSIPMDVAALYTSTDGSTKLYITLTESDDLTVSVTVNSSVANAGYIDFGDGSNTSDITGSGINTISHTYTSTGEYVISIFRTDTTGYIRLGSHASNASETTGNCLSSKTILTKIVTGHARYGRYAFCNNTKLKSVIVPAYIGFTCNYSTFKGCSSLSFFCTSSVDPNIGSHGLENCSSLKVLSLASISSSNESYMYNGCTSLERLCLSSSSSNFYRVQEGLCQGCTRLKNVYLTENITSVSSYSFKGCSKLEEVSNFSNLKSIGNYAFAYCKRLKVSKISSYVSKLNSSVFANCYSLSITEIPESITTINNLAFYSAYYSTHVITFKGIPTSISNNVFDSCYGLDTINVPWSEGAVANAPWGAINATINYDYTGE